tara:strand:- start:672 stop:1241 length:570 start_codon:yes stop_codon:yes gene_type:complete
MDNQLKQTQKAFSNSLFQNNNYQIERRHKETFTLQWIASSDGDTSINETLMEPFLIDRLSDIYLESFTTWHADLTNNNGLNIDVSDANEKLNRSSFVLKINEFSNSSGTNDTNINNRLVIPHEIPHSGSGNWHLNHRKVHKSRKLNYICSIDPTILTQITGTITGLTNSTGMFANNDRFIAEFVVIGRD